MVVMLIKINFTFKKFNVSGTGLKILDRVGTHYIIILGILKGILPFKMHKIIFFPENLEKN